MRIRVEAELKCEECGAEEWTKATLTLNEELDIDSVPSCASVIERYSAEYYPPPGWIEDKEFGGHRHEVCPVPKVVTKYVNVHHRVRKPGEGAAIQETVEESWMRIYGRLPSGTNLYASNNCACEEEGLDCVRHPEGS